MPFSLRLPNFYWSFLGLFVWVQIRIWKVRIKSGDRETTCSNSACEIFWSPSRSASSMIRSMMNATSSSLISLLVKLLGRGPEIRTEQSCSDHLIIWRRSARPRNSSPSKSERGIGWPIQNWRRTVNSECVFEFQLQGRHLGEHGEHVQKVVEGQVATAILREHLADPPAEWVFLTDFGTKLTISGSAAPQTFSSGILPTSSNVSLTIEAWLPCMLPGTFSGFSAWNRLYRRRISFLVKKVQSCGKGKYRISEMQKPNWV